jgi:hypothetical protein
MDESFVAKVKSRVLDARAQEDRREELIQAALKEFQAITQQAADEVAEGIRQAAEVQIPVTACVSGGWVVLSVNGESKSLCSLKYQGGREGSKEFPWFICGSEQREAYEISVKAIRECLLWAAELHAREILTWVTQRSKAPAVTHT